MTYRIVRGYSPGAPGRKRSRVMDTGLTLEEVQAHCGRDDTHGGVDCGACGLWSRGREVVKSTTGKRCPDCLALCSRAWSDGYEEE